LLFSDVVTRPTAPQARQDKAKTYPEGHDDTTDPPSTQ